MSKFNSEGLKKSLKRLIVRCVDEANLWADEGTVEAIAYAVNMHWVEFDGSEDNSALDCYIVVEIDKKFPELSKSGMDACRVHTLAQNVIEKLKDVFKEMGQESKLSGG